MMSEVNWQPFVFTLQVFGVFVLVCLAAGASDLYAKGSRKPRRRRQPVSYHKGERIYLN